MTIEEYKAISGPLAEEPVRNPGCYWVILKQLHEDLTNATNSLNIAQYGYHPTLKKWIWFFLGFDADKRYMTDDQIEEIGEYIEVPDIYKKRGFF
jgi:hypothetical protein